MSGARRCHGHRPIKNNTGMIYWLINLTYLDRGSWSPPEMTRASTGATTGRQNEMNHNFEQQLCEMTLKWHWNGSQIRLNMQEKNRAWHHFRVNLVNKVKLPHTHNENGEKMFLVSAQGSMDFSSSHSKNSLILKLEFLLVPLSPLRLRRALATAQLATLTQRCNFNWKWHLWWLKLTFHFPFYQYHSPWCGILRTTEIIWQQFGTLPVFSPTLCFEIKCIKREHDN